MQRLVRLVRRWFRYLRRHKWIVFLWVLGAFFFLTGLGLLWAATLPLPDLTSLSQIRVDQSVKIYDRTGQVLLYSLSNNDVQRTVVPLSEVSPNIQDAIIAIEDPNFYQNDGIDIKGYCAGAARRHYAPGRRAGRLDPDPAGYQKHRADQRQKPSRARSRSGCWRSSSTRALTKQQILELYLNQVPYGGTMYGVEEASETFFGIHGERG